MVRKQTSRLLFKKLDHMDCLVSENGNDLQWINSISVNVEDEDGPAELIWEKLFDEINGTPNRNYIYRATYHLGASSDPTFAGIIFPRYKVNMADVMNGNCAYESNGLAVGYFSGFEHNDFYSLHIRHSYYSSYWHDAVPGDEMLFTHNGYQLYRQMFDTKYWKENQGICIWHLANYGIYAVIYNSIDVYDRDSALFVYIPVNRETFKMGEYVKIAEWKISNPPDWLSRFSLEGSIALDSTLVSVIGGQGYIALGAIFSNGKRKEKIFNINGRGDVLYFKRFGPRALFYFQAFTGYDVYQHGYFINDDFSLTPVSYIGKLIDDLVSYSIIRVVEDDDEYYMIYAIVAPAEGTEKVEIYKSYDMNYMVKVGTPEPIIVESVNPNLRTNKIRLYFDAADSETEEEVDFNLFLNPASMISTENNYCHENCKVAYKPELMMVFYYTTSVSNDYIECFIDNLKFESSDNNFYTLSINGALGSEIEINEALWNEEEEE